MTFLLVAMFVGDIDSNVKKVFSPTFGVLLNICCLYQDNINATRWDGIAYSLDRILLNCLPKFCKF